MKGIRTTTLVVIGTDCIGSCKSNYHTITTMTAPKTSILIFVFYVFFSSENGWIAVRELRCAIYFGLVIATCLIFIGSAIFIQTTFRLRFHPKPLNQDFRMLWYAPPSWVNTTGYKIENCEFTNCEISFDKKEINNSDLVLFHHNNMDFKSPMKTANQKWVFVSLEAPHNTFSYYKEKQWTDKFDWTMTYRSDSEGYGPYGKIIPAKIIKEENHTAIFAMKTKDAVWVVSNCNTASKREKYVKEMQKVINVDIFGNCGKPCVQNGIDCIQNLSKYYKYYLAFENSICEDYVTEKLFRLYNTNFNIIPVVRGAPNVKELFPPNTFISTQDYKSPADLAKHLKEIGSNEATYTAILKTKQKYINTLDLYPLGMCSLCKNLNRNNIEIGIVQSE